MYNLKTKSKGMANWHTNYFIGGKASASLKTLKMSYIYIYNSGRLKLNVN